MRIPSDVVSLSPQAGVATFNYNEVIVKQTYENYYKNYYRLNKEKIKSQTKKYRRKYNKEYYNKNKEEINLRRKEKRDREKIELERLRTLAEGVLSQDVADGKV